MNENFRLGISKNFLVNIENNFQNINSNFSKYKIIWMNLYSFILMIFGIILILLNDNEDKEISSFLNSTTITINNTLSPIIKNTTNYLLMNLKSEKILNKNKNLQEANSTTFFNNDSIKIERSVDYKQLDLSKFLNVILLGCIIILVYTVIFFIIMKFKNMLYNLKKVFFQIISIIFSILNLLLIKIFYILMIKKMEYDFTTINLISNLLTLILLSYYINLIDSKFKNSLISMFLVNGLFIVFSKFYIFNKEYSISLNIFNDFLIFFLNFICNKIKLKNFVFTFFNENSQNDFKSMLDCLENGFISINENMDFIVNDYFLRILFEQEEFKSLKNYNKYNKMQDKEIYSDLKLHYENTLKLKLFAILFENIIPEYFYQETPYNQTFYRNINNNFPLTSENLSNLNVIGENPLHINKINDEANVNLVEKNIKKESLQNQFTLNNKESPIDRSQTKLNHFFFKNKTNLLKLIKYTKELKFEIKDQVIINQILFDDKDLQLKLSRNHTMKTDNYKIKEQFLNISLMPHYNKKIEFKISKFDNFNNKRIFSIIDDKNINESISLKNRILAKSKTYIINEHSFENSQNDSKIEFINKNNILRSNTLENKESNKPFQIKNYEENKFTLGFDNFSHKNKKLSEFKDEIMKTNFILMNDFLKNLKNNLFDTFIEKSKLINTNTHKTLMEKGGNKANLIFLRKNETYDRIEIIFKNIPNSFQDENLNFGNKISDSTQKNNSNSNIFLFSEKKTDYNEKSKDYLTCLEKNRENLITKAFDENSISIFNNLQNKISHELLNPLINLMNYLKDSKNYLEEEGTTIIVNNNLNIPFKKNLYKSSISLNKSSISQANSSCFNSNINLIEIFKKNQKNNFATERSYNNLNQNDSSIIPLKRSTPVNNTLLNTIIETNQEELNPNKKEKKFSNIFSKETYNNLISNLKDSQNISKIIKFVVDDIISILNLNLNLNNNQRSRKYYATRQDNSGINLLKKSDFNLSENLISKDAKHDKSLNLNKFINVLNEKFEDQISKNAINKSTIINKFKINDTGILSKNNFLLKGNDLILDDDNTKYILKNDETDLTKKMELLKFEYENNLEKNYIISVINDSVFPNKPFKESIITTKNCDINKKTEMITNSIEKNNENNSNISSIEFKRISAVQKGKNFNTSILNNGIMKNNQKIYFRTLIDNLEKESNKSSKIKNTRVREIKNLSHSLITDFVYYSKINIQKLIKKIMKIAKTKLNLLNKNMQIKVKYLSKREEILKTSNLSATRNKDSETNNKNNTRNYTNSNKKAHINEKNKFLIFSNEDLIQQSLFNLITNSIKFTRVGKIVIEVSNEEKNLIIKIKDTGIGIEYQTFKKLGAPFVKSEKANNIYGMGMGIYICTNNIKNLKGKIDLITCEEMGTTFILVIPNNSEQIMDKNLNNFNYMIKNFPTEKSVFNLSGKININKKEESLIKKNSGSTNANFLTGEFKNIGKRSSKNINIINIEQNSNHNSNYVREDNNKKVIKKQSTININLKKNKIPNNLHNKFVLCNPKNIMNKIQQTNLIEKIAIFSGDNQNKFSGGINLNNSPININIYNNYEGVNKTPDYYNETSMSIRILDLNEGEYQNANSERCLNKNDIFKGEKWLSRGESTLKNAKKKSLSTNTIIDLREKLETPEYYKKPRYFESSCNTIFRQISKKEKSGRVNACRINRFPHEAQVVELSLSQDKSIDFCSIKQDNNSHFSRDNLNKNGNNLKNLNTIRNESIIIEDSEFNSLRNDDNNIFDGEINNSFSNRKDSILKDTISYSGNLNNLKQHMKSFSRFYDTQKDSSNNVNSSTNKNSSKNFNDMLFKLRTFELNSQKDITNNSNKNLLKNIKNKIELDKLMTYNISHSESNVDDINFREGTFTINNLQNNKTSCKNLDKEEFLQLNFKEESKSPDNRDETNKFKYQQFIKKDSLNKEIENDHNLKLIHYDDDSNSSNNENIQHHNNNLLRILIVDDESIIRKSHKKLFEKYFLQNSNSNYIIEECEDGIECLFKIYMGYKLNIQYDIIVTDETMNFLSGSRLANIIHELKKDSIINNIQVFLVSSYKLNTFNPINKEIIFADCFCKPMTKKNIELLLQTFGLGL